MTTARSAAGNAERSKRRLQAGSARRYSHRRRCRHSGFRGRLREHLVERRGPWHDRGSWLPANNRAGRVLGNVEAARSRLPGHSPWRYRGPVEGRDPRWRLGNREHPHCVAQHGRRRILHQDVAPSTPDLQPQIPLLPRSAQSPASAAG